MKNENELSSAGAASQRTPDPAKLDQLLGQMVGDLGACVNGALVILGDRLGLYRSLGDHGPMTSVQFAEKTGMDERQLREWLSAQAASGYICYDAGDNTFSLSPEQYAVFADPDSPAAITGGFYSVSAVYHDEPLVAESFRTGSGVPWGEHHNCLFCGTERFFRPGYQANLVSNWIPSLEGGARERLESGVRAADIGCGRGASTLIMAAAFPRSEFTGYDLHAGSIEAANRLASEAGLTNVRFEVASAQEFQGKGYAFITMFDALHDMGDPEGGAARIREALDSDGTFMLVEPRAGDSLAENLNPVGRVYYGFSAAVCTPAALSQKKGDVLGAQAGDRRLGKVLSAAGFTRVRRAAETPFNVVIEARP